MAKRHVAAALVAMAAVAASAIAASAGAFTPKQAMLRGVPAAPKAQAEQKVRHLIVRLRDGTPGSPLGARTSLRAFEQAIGVGLTPVRELAGGGLLVELPAALPVSQAKNVAARLARDGAVEYADADVMYRRLAVPSDPRFANYQWNLFDPTALFTADLLNGAGNKRAAATGGANLPRAWDLTSGGATSVVVAIIDTGIVNHPDLNGVTSPSPYLPAGRFVAGYDFVSFDVGAENALPANFVANDGDGRDADPTDPGDWVTTADEAQFGAVCDDGSPGPQDSSWHGTHMAGVAAASSNNQLGVAGIGWNVRVQPVRALGKCGGSLSDIEEAIRWAAGLPVPNVPVNATPARVISLSLGGSEACSPSMQAAVDAAIAAGSVVVAATGNESDTALISPANCRGVIAVTGHTINGENADYANIGASTTISAPGGGSPILLGAGGPTDDSNWIGYYVWSTLLYGTTDPWSSDAEGKSGPAYGGFTGTSVAAPHVAGVAALIKSVLPTASPGQVRDFLVANARPFPAGSACASGGTFDGQCGAGMLDASAAIGRAVLSAPPVIVTGPQSVTIEEGRSATLTVSAAGAANLTYQWKRNGVDIPGATAPTYTTPALSTSDSGTRYSVVVTNGLGTVASPEAIVTVVPVGSGGPASPPVGGGGGGALPLGQLLLLGVLLLGARLRRRA